MIFRAINSEATSQNALKWLIFILFPGPTLLFERITNGAGSGKRFFACGACRDRRECNFFQWEENTISVKVKEALKKAYEYNKPQYTAAQYHQR